MTVTTVRKDPQALTMAIDAEFDASPERVWQLWADPRQLERWWGPPSYPATFTRHDLAPGSRVEYHMTGPEGDQPHGYWDIVEVNPPRPRRRRQPHGAGLPGDDPGDGGPGDRRLGQPHWPRTDGCCVSAARGPGFAVDPRWGGPLTWVELREIEPLTPCMPCKCSAS